MGIKKIFAFILMFSVIFSGSASVSLNKVFCAATEVSDEQDTMKEEDWKIVANQDKNNQENSFKSIQKNEATEDKFLDDINIYYIGGISLLIIGSIGVVCSVCSLFRIKKIKRLSQKQ